MDVCPATGTGSVALGYAATGHAQGRTVHAWLRDYRHKERQYAYVALTRGTGIKTAYVFTLSPKRADPVPGPRPASELARYDQINRTRPPEAASLRGSTRRWSWGEDPRSRR